MLLTNVHGNTKEFSSKTKEDGKKRKKEEKGKKKQINKASVGQTGRREEKLQQWRREKRRGKRKMSE